MKKYLFFSFLFLTLTIGLMSFSPSNGDPVAKEIVQKADQKLKGLTSQGEIKMTIVRPKWQREMVMKSWSKGDELSVILVTSPARDKGTAFVAVDAAQSVGMIPVDVPALGVDVFATSPHKWVQSPKGLGLAFFSEAVQEVLQPM